MRRNSGDALEREMDEIRFGDAVKRQGFVE